MNALVRKEIRLLLPSWLVAMLLALAPICTRSDDGIAVFLLFFGMAMMGLTSIGRESSLNTFSHMLAQPMERTRIWKTKLTVLVVAFLAVFSLWLLAILFSFIRFGVPLGVGAADPEASAAVLIAGCLVLVATFTGGLWAALLLRQIAGAFWLMLLVPATLGGFTTAFVSASRSYYDQTNGMVIAALCLIIGLYSVGGFLFARWLFFRAQDVGWTGGIIALPELKIFGTRPGPVDEIRRRRPLAALIKKEIQLQQVSLLGAAGLLILHIGVIILRAHHKFPRDSAGEILTTIAWMLWLVMPVIVGAMAIAEERRLGVMEGQLCLPASRRGQFVIKGLLTLFLGVFLGGAMPWLVEMAGGGFRMGHMSKDDNLTIMLGLFGLSLWLSLVSFFASSMARNFLQAVGFALATFMFSSLVFPAFTNGRMIYFDSIPLHSILPLVIAGPTLAITLFGLAYWNYKNFRDGWQALRRSLLVFGAMLLFVMFGSTAIYNRAWEVFEPAEPAHGAAKLILANPPELSINRYNESILVKLPDGRVWFDFLTEPDDGRTHGSWVYIWQNLFPELPKSIGPQKFLSGSNWVCATAQHIDTWVENRTPEKEHIHIHGYTESFGVQPDGTLWISEKSDQNRWTADTLTQFGEATDWKQAIAYDRIGSVLLLKTNGSLWQLGHGSNLGTNRFDWTHWPQNWPGLRTFQPRQVGTNLDWNTFFSFYSPVVKKNDGSVWQVWADNSQKRLTNYDQIPLQMHSGNWQWGTYIRADGTLWGYGDLHQRGHDEFEKMQSGRDTNWAAVATSWESVVGLKTDGTLWIWNSRGHSVAESITAPPVRLGIHNDWVAVAGIEGCVVSMAADGSLWFWPSRDHYRYDEALMRLPKQPRLLGNVFGQTR